MICDLILIGDARLKQVSQEIQSFDKDLEIFARKYGRDDVCQ